MLNVNKTKIMILPANNTTNQIEEFECVNEIKYLGIIIDSKLNFKKHFEFVNKKIAQRIGFFRNIRKKLCIQMSIKIYNSIIRPHFEYCPTILLMGSMSMIEGLQKLQNKAMRSILYCSSYTAISSMLESLKWLSIKQRIVMSTLIFIFKIKNNMCRTL